MKNIDHRSNELPRAVHHDTPCVPAAVQAAARSKMRPSRGSAALVRSAVAAVLALGLAHAGAASAQSADSSSSGAAAAADPADTTTPSQLQEIVVTGYRSSLEQALKIKQNMSA